jgi:hypothetical protein
MEKLNILQKYLYVQIKNDLEWEKELCTFYLGDALPFSFNCAHYTLATTPAPLRIDTKTAYTLWTKHMNWSHFFGITGWRTLYVRTF